MMGGIGKQVMGELGGVVKKAVEDTGKAGVDVVKGTIENVVGGPAPRGVQGGTEQAGEEQAGMSNDPAQVIKQQAAVKKQKGLQRVRQELADYVAKKKQKDSQEEMVEERQEEIKKDQEEQEKESERDFQIAQAQRSGGGTGEMARKKH